MSTKEHGDEGATRRWYLVSYDIRDARRWRAAFRLLRGTGEWLQYSLFRCQLSRTGIAQLRWELERILDEEDDLLIVRLCPRCAAAVEARGKPDGWDRATSRFSIV